MKSRKVGTISGTISGTMRNGRDITYQEIK